MFRFTLLALLVPPAVNAGTIDVTNDVFALLHTGDSIVIEAGVGNYGLHNPGVSPYPTGLGFSLIATKAVAPRLAMFASSSDYYPGYLFQGYLRSLDGSVTAPLNDPVAEMLGLSSGQLVLAPGEYSGAAHSGRQVGVIYGSANLTLETAQALFGSSFLAEIVIRNLGPDVLLGLGDGYTIRNSAAVPDVSGFGQSRVGGIPLRATIETPELGTWILAATAAAALWLLRRAIPTARVAPERTPGRSRV